LLEPLNTPVSGKLGLELSTDGDLKTANLALDFARGTINLPALSRGEQAGR
jgi:hypothetical protein